MSRFETEWNVGRDGSLVLPEGIAVPLRCRTTVDDERLPYRVVLEISFDEARGRLVVASITATTRPGGPPVTSMGLRTLPIDGLVRGAVAQTVVSVNRSNVLMLAAQDPATLTADGPTDDVLRVVAALYRIADVSGVPPVAAVVADLERPRPTVARWVRMARERGFLSARPKNEGDVQT